MLETQQQENAQTPERVTQTPEEQEVEVRGYDALHTEKVIGEVALNTHGAITKVTAEKNGPKPVPETVNATTPANDEAEKRAKKRLDEIYETLDPKLTADVDTMLNQEIQKYPNSMFTSITEFLRKANFGFKLKDIGVGETDKYSETTTYNNTPLQVKRHGMRVAFIEELIAHGQQTVEDHIKSRLANYSHMLFEAQKKLTQGKEQTVKSGPRYYVRLTPLLELKHSVKDGEVRYFYGENLVDLSTYRQ